MSQNSTPFFVARLRFQLRFGFKRPRRRMPASKIASSGWQLSLILLAVLCGAQWQQAKASAPVSASLGPTATAPLSWVGTATGPTSTSPVTNCREGIDCDTFILTFTGTTADWAGKTSIIRVRWQLPVTDYDLYILRELPSGQYVIAQSTNNPTNSHDTEETIDFSPAFYGTGRYLVRVIYAAATFRDQYEGSATVVSNESSCRVPGLTVLNDQQGDSTDAQANHDIESVSVAEPYLMGESKLVFTMKVSGLDSLSTNTFWRIYFRTPNISQPRYFVDMRSNAAMTIDHAIVNAVSYTYGTGDGTTLGQADEGHYSPQKGTITITLSRSKIGNPQPNQYPAHKLEQIYAQVIVGTTAADSAPNSDFDLSQASYTIVGNSNCNPGKVAFTSNIDGNNEVYVMDAGGGNPVNLTHHSATEFSPSWSPDGRKLAFSSSRSGGQDIFVMDADGSNLSNLTNISGSDLEPAWSPDGTKIAFDGWRDTDLASGTAQIYVMNASGTNQTRLTHDMNYYRDPSWSPDGKRLAFWGGAGTSQIYVMSADGTILMPLTHDTVENIHSAWSPDGTRIAFSSKRDQSYDIYVIDADGSNLRRLTQGAGDDFHPAWSPDSMMIVFSSMRDGNAELYIMNADGSNQTRLTNSPAAEIEPAWQPNFSPSLPQPAPPIVFTKQSDFDGDNKADLAFWRSSNITWNIINSSDGSTRIQAWGDSSDVPVPGYYDGDGRTDLAMVTPRDGSWQILLSQSGALRIMPFGQKGDVPAPGDYDGDGLTDIAFYRPTEARWYIMQSGGGGTRIQQWGTTYDRIAPGDYDGDGKTDLAIYRPNEGRWYISNSNGGTQTPYWGALSDRIVPADYDGDGKTDVAVYRPSELKWYILKSTGGSTATHFGGTGDMLVPADYDGDGRADIAVWRPSDGIWRILRSSDGTTRLQQWGVNLDLPLLYVGVG